MTHIHCERCGASINSNGMDPCPKCGAFATVSFSFDSEATNASKRRVDADEEEFVNAFREHPWSEKYEIIEEIGRGGMGLVFRAMHRALRKQVAIKLLLPERSPHRFLREAQILASITSPHVVAINDYDLLDDARPMICMNWLDGGDLSNIANCNPDGVSEEELVPWMLQTATGMNTVAEHGLIHRDLKPSNVLLSAKKQALISDFGLANSFEEIALTESSKLQGTPAYMSPEQAEQPRAVDTRSDIYSFGATFYHLACASPPFQGDGWLSVLLKHKTEPLVSPRARRPSLSVTLSDVIERCLAKSPGDRFASFQDIMDSLENASLTEQIWKEPTNEAMSKFSRKYFERKQAYIAGVFHEDEYVFPNKRMLLIRSGNIADQDTEAIVSSDNSQLEMQNGISSAIASAAGPGIRRFVKSLAPVQVGRAVVTPAGNLPARIIIHAATTQIRPEEIFQPSPYVIAESIRACIYHADSHGIRSISFPFLGCGIGGFSKSVCLDMMLRTLSDILNRGITSLDHVRIVLLDPRRATDRWYERIRNSTEQTDAAEP